MKYHLLCMRILAPLLVALPGVAHAQALSQAVGLFNVFVGLMLVGALLTYGIGFVVWCVRLGTWPTYRTEAIKIMEWSVVILFVLVVLLGVVQFFQHHPRAAGYTIAVILLAIVAGVILVLAAKGGGKEDEKKP